MLFLVNISFFIELAKKYYDNLKRITVFLKNNYSKIFQSFISPVADELNKHPLDDTKCK